MKARILDLAYLLAAFLGALLVAANIGAALYGYVLFLISSILGGYLAYNSNASRSLLYVNIMFGLINVLGIVRAL